jgi:hypothetical protein
MKERQILFSAPMVRALLDGSKTQTRRIVKWQGRKGFPHYFNRAFIDNPAGVQRLCVPFHHPDDLSTLEGAPAVRHYCPQGDPGDRLWVRETIELRTMQGNSFPSPVYSADGAHVMDGEKKASNHEFMRRRVRPSIHMPRWASRITLEITDVRVERLQDISEEDAKAEGIEQIGCNWRNYLDGADSMTSPIHSYRTLWESINGAGSWDANPWVWCITFRRLP